MTSARSSAPDWKTISWASCLACPMGCDVCYTNHAAADQNSADNLLMLLTAAGCNYFMGVPCSDDVMLNYQSTSFHDALAVRRLFNLRPAPEFLAWLHEMGLYKEASQRGSRQAQGSNWQRGWKGDQDESFDQIGDW